jgi:hypothetical protein
MFGGWSVKVLRSDRKSEALSGEMMPFFLPQNAPCRWWQFTDLKLDFSL